jgi:hypothetical protein
MTPVAALPAELCGVWTFQGSSGGMDGHGNAGYRVAKIVIGNNNRIEEHHAGGTVTRDTFTPGRGKSIFSTAEVWMMRRQHSAFVEVLTLTTNQDLTISENVYDGFSYSFKRAAPSPGPR